MIGGAALASFNTESIIFPYNLKEGDIMVLTKPLGTQMAVNAFQWMKNKTIQYQKINSFITDE